MGKKLPFDDIPKPSQDMPKGAFLFSIENIEQGATNDGRFMVTTTYRCVEPEEYAGRLHFERYTFGNAQDPNADEPETIKKSRGAQAFKDHLLKAKVKPSNDLDKLAASAKDQVVGFVFREYTEKDVRADGSPNPYAGEVRTRINKAFMQGEIPLGEGDVGRGVPKPKVAAVPPKPAAPAKPARVAEPDDDEDEPAPAKKAVAARKPADYDEDDDD